MLKKIMFISMSIICGFCVVFVACAIIFDDAMIFQVSYFKFYHLLHWRADSYFYDFLRNFAGIRHVEYVELGIIAICGILYALPSIIAVARNHPHCLAVVMINIFLGWSVVGWILACVWSVKNDFMSKIMVSKKLPFKSL